MARGPSSNPIAPSPSWHKRPICPECGNKVRRPRPNNEKRCSRCKELLPISDFGHAIGRADHRSSYCRPCHRTIQNKSSRHIRGTAQPLSDFSPVGDQTTVLVGTFVRQGPLSDYRETPGRIGPQLVKYETPTHQPVHEMWLAPSKRPEGTAADHIGIVHAFTDLARAPLEAGQWLCCVIQSGQLEKVIRAGDRDPIVDTSLDITEGEDSALGLRFGSFALARPWILPLALEFTVGAQGKELKQEGCPLCGHPSGQVQDFTLRCDVCTEGRRWSAAEILVEHAEVDAEWVFEFISGLESIWLLGLMPSEVSVSA